MSTPSSPVGSETLQQQPQAALSEPSRLLGVFIRPSKTFADLNRSAKWWAPFLLLIVMNLAFTVTIDRTAGFSAMAEQGLRQNPKASERMDSLPPDQRERQMAVVTKFVKYAAYASPLSLLIVVLIVAAILMGTFNFGFARELRFGPTVAVVVYSLLPSAIYTLLAIIVLAVSSHPGDINLQNVAATNLAFFVDESTTSPSLYALLRSFDIFYVWPVALIGIGLAAIGAGKRSTSLAVVFGWWFLLLIGLVGLKALNS